MASRKSYPCFACRDSGFDNVMVLLDGKDSEGKTKYLNEDGTRHTHKVQQQSSSTNIEQPEQSSVDKGISAFSMMTDLIRLVEQNQKLLTNLNEKVDRLLNLTFAKQEQQQQK
jgi:hypothetical protein